MSAGDVQQYLLRLGDPANRKDALRRLAASLSVENVLMFVLDPDVGVPVPVAGMPKTIAAGRSWREFIASCTQPGRREGQVEFPPGTHRPALALTSGAATVALVGGSPDAAGLAELERWMPLLAALLTTEQQVILARAEADAARQSERHAQHLASALESARAETAALNAHLRQEQVHKDQFLAMLGHELRNPLAPLVTALEGLRLQPGEHKVVSSEIIDMMNRQTRQLSRLVEDLLDVSRVSRGRIELRHEVLSVADILEGAIEVSQSEFDVRSQKVIQELPDEDVQVLGDRVRLTQVFGNLLNNASKYSEAGSTIRVTATKNRDRVVVKVADSGIGMSKEMLDQVFDLFTQAPVAIDRAEGGLGIGLTLVRRLVELHDGEVTAHSAGESQGSTFTVTLPLAEGDAPAEFELAADAGSELSAYGDGGRSLNLMVVDDNHDAANAMAELLGLLGHRVSVAHDGHAPLKMPETGDVDVFFLDIGLPGMNGYELARELRHVAKPGARFYAVTGYGSTPEDAAPDSKCFDEHVVKPVTLDTLRRLLQDD